MEDLGRQTANLNINAPPKFGPNERLYPPEMVQAIKEALQGLPYIYIMSRPLSLRITAKVPRTKYTPYSAPSFQSMVPPYKRAVFTVPYYPHLKEYYNEDNLDIMSPRNGMSKPYDEREVQWLEEFLKACDFMMKLD